VAYWVYRCIVEYARPKDNLRRTRAIDILYSGRRSAAFVANAAEQKVRSIILAFESPGSYEPEIEVLSCTARETG